MPISTRPAILSIVFWPTLADAVHTMRLAQAIRDGAPRAFARVRAHGIALAAVAHFYGLANIPNGFSPDEASYGYHGYSFLLTGRDRFGNAFPLFADNFGDLISTSYMWLTVPSIWLFGLDEFAVRLPAASRVSSPFLCYISWGGRSSTAGSG